MTLSVIIPVFNAEKSISELIKQLSADLNGIDYEVVLINDGSSDTTENICEELAAAHAYIKFISLRKNFGEHNAVLCGLNFAKGDYSVIIDDDFQNPPSEIPKLLAEAEKGYDVVYSKYRIKKHSLFRNLLSAMNNGVANFLISKPKDLYLSSFKIIKSDVVEEIIKYKGPFPYIDGLILRTTNSIGSIYVNHSERMAGRSNYTLAKLFSLYLSMFINFSIRPLRIFTIAGVFIFLLGLGLSLYFVIEKYIYGDPPGWTSTILIILMFSGFQIIFLGLMGEYLGKQYLDQNKTPQWVIKKKIND